MHGDRSMEYKNFAIVDIEITFEGFQNVISFFLI